MKKVKVLIAVAILMTASVFYAANAACETNGTPSGDCRAEHGGSGELLCYTGGTTCTGSVFDEAGDGR
jgi:hypothetical protein